MKIILQLIAVLLLTIAASDTATAQLPATPPTVSTRNVIPCGFDELLQAREASDPNLKPLLRSQESLLAGNKTGQQSGGAPPTANNPAIIPIVVHVISDAQHTYNNISDAQIDAQITALNDEFLASNVYIKFCFATIKPNGDTVWGGKQGVDRFFINGYTEHRYTTAGMQSLTGLVYYPPTQYLNIWVVSSICTSDTGTCDPSKGGIMGYGAFPNVYKDIDGVVIRGDVFGDNSRGGQFNLINKLDQGKVLVHEMGHYLYLYHTFQGGCTDHTSARCDTTGDLVCDTPPALQDTLCSSTIASCGTTQYQQQQNYMAYTRDACRTLFSNGQRDSRMYKCLQIFRSNLISTSNLIQTGVQCRPVGLSPVFTTDSRSKCIGDNIVYTYTPTAGNTANYYHWNFPGGNPSSYTGQGPVTVNYASAGKYSVSLTVANTTDTVTNTKKDVIYVSNCNPINSNQGNWDFGYYKSVDFFTGKLVAKPGPFDASFGCATESDPATGKKILTTNGFTILDGNGNSASNVITGISNFIDKLNNSPTDGVSFIKKPGSTSQYYCFYVAANRFNTLNHGVNYSLIDISLTNSNGAQGTALSVDQLMPMFSATDTIKTNEAVIAIPAFDQSSYWVVTTGVNGIYANKLIAYKVTGSGISLPVISQARHEDANVIKPAPNGKYVYLGSAHAHKGTIYEFDRINGTFAMIDTTVIGVNGVSFSPNSKLMYAVQGSYILQYDVSSLSYCNHSSPYTYIRQDDDPFAKLQIAPDGKLYHSIRHQNAGDINGLSVINYPDSVNTPANTNACGYVFNDFKYPSSDGTGTWIGLPNMIDAKRDDQAEFNFCIDNCTTAHFHNLHAGTNFSWNFGDGQSSSQENPTHLYPASASPISYTVTLSMVNYAGITVSTSHTLTILPAPVVTANGNAVSKVCGGVQIIPENYSVGNIQNGDTYTWNITNGNPATSTGSSVDVIWNKAGKNKVKVTATNQNGCSKSDSIIVNVSISNLKADAGPDISQSSTPVRIGGSPTASQGYQPYTYNWTPKIAFTGSTTIANPTVNPPISTVYTVTVMDSIGCSASDSVLVNRVQIVCGHPYNKYLGSYGKIDTVDAQGGTINFTGGDYYILSSIVLKNGTFNIQPGSTWFIDGYNKRPYSDASLDNDEYLQYANPNGIKGSYIFLYKATLNINGAKLQASCDTMWGGILNIYDDSHFYPNHGAGNYINKLRTNSSSGHSTHIEDCYSGLNIGADTTSANYLLGTHGNIRNAKFINCSRAVSVKSGFDPGDKPIIDSITGINSDCIPSQMKWPAKYLYTYVGIDLSTYHRPTFINSDTIENAIFGVAMQPYNDQAFVAQIRNSRFDNNIIAALYQSSPYQTKDSSVVANCTINLPTTVVNNSQVPASFVGKSMGVFAYTNGLTVRGNIFNGASGLSQQAVVCGEFTTNLPFGIRGNTFNVFVNAISGLGQHSQMVEYNDNTFNNCKNSIVIDQNAQAGSGPAPSIFIHCNNFTKGTATSPANAILVATQGQTGTIGACANGSVAGNSYMGYSSGTNFGIINANANFTLRYYRSNNEKAGINFGQTNGLVNFPTCSSFNSNSYCGPVGQAYVAVRPTLVDVLLAVTQLVSNLLLTEAQYQKQVLTLVNYYTGNCGPQYQQTINQMLPMNLRAYNDLSWNLAECYASSGSPAAAIQVANQIAYNNPGNVQILQRTNYYTAMLNINAAQRDLSGRLNVSASDINLLAQVAASGTEYSAMACYTLLGIAPDRTVGCFSLPLGARLEDGSTPEPLKTTDLVTFTAAPNPFSETTTIAYRLAGSVKSAELHIYDLQGRLVKVTLIDLNVGEITVKASDLKDGIYIYTIATDGSESRDKKRLVVIH